VLDLPGTWCDQFGEVQIKAKLSDVRYNPKSNFNLFSLGKAIKEGWKMSGDKNGIILKKGDARLAFDIKIETQNGIIFCAYFKRDSEVAAGFTEPGTKMTVDKAHRIAGPHDESQTCKKIAKDLGWSLNPGPMKPCEACTIAKAKQKNV
jgi:hypothetical protein